MELSFEQARVLGSLIEKQMTTPDYYPMTVNALVAACNQRNNREPVTAFDDTDIERLLSELNDLDLARFTRQSGGRTLKYLHRAPDTLEVDDEQLAILAIMMLRGPQTLAELKSRTERYVDFPTLDAVEERVTDLMEALTAVTIATPPANVPTEAEPIRSDLEARVADLERTVEFLLAELGMEAPEDEMTDDR